MEEIIKQTNITIIDAIMGTGKSRFAISNIINKNPDKKFLCVLPTNSECERYAKESHCEVYYTDDTKKRIGTKKEYFKLLVTQNKSIATTHYLIEHLDKDIIQLLQENQYILIIDECLDVVHKLPDLANSDVKLLFNDNWISADENGIIRWNYEKDAGYDGYFRQVQNLCETESLFALKLKDGSISKEFLMWQFPCKFFTLFNQVYILTYMWNGSIQKNYFDLNKIQYEHMTLVGNDGIQTLFPYNRTKELAQRERMKKLINIHYGKENQIGKKEGKANPLSESWFDKNSKTKDKALLVRLQKNTYNYFHNVQKSSSDENMFTVYKKYKSSIQGRGYTKGFVPCNSKGTNEFRNKRVLAYLINFFMPLEIERFFAGYGVVINANLLSLSELLQWIWRSRIREGLQIEIYIPSERMRTLLEQWLNGEI